MGGTADEDDVVVGGVGNMGDYRKKAKIQVYLVRIARQQFLQ